MIPEADIMAGRRQSIPALRRQPSVALSATMGFLGVRLSRNSASSRAFAVFDHRSAALAAKRLAGRRRSAWRRAGSQMTRMYGPAVRCKWILPSWRWAVLHQCIRPLIGVVVLLAIMDISARAVSLPDRPQRAIRVTSVRRRREDRTSISSHPLADLGR